MKATHHHAFVAKCQTQLDGQNLLAVALVMVIALVTTATAQVADTKPHRPQHRLAAMCILLACVGALGVATVARAQTVTPRLGTPPFARDGLTRETAPTLYDAPDGQRPVGFEPPDRRGLDRFHLLAAAAPSAGAGAGSGAAPADAQANAAELAKKLQNPIADLISVPLQNNWDFGIGPADAMRYTVNIQPVIPVSLSTEWNLIIRTIMPVIYAASPVPGGDNKAGLGDITQSFFFSPKTPTSGGWIWGVGPVFLYPTATDSALGSEKFGLGPTAVVLKQEHGWTYGMLANHIWSVAGNGSRDNVSSTFLQPFLTYTTKSSPPSGSTRKPRTIGSTTRGPCRSTGSCSSC